MISQKCLIDDLKKITLKIVGPRNVGMTYLSKQLEEYKKIVIQVIEKQPKFYIPDNNKPLSFEDFEHLKWVWDNQGKEYIRIEEYDGWHECYWVSTIEELNVFRVYKEDCKENRFYRWEVVEDDE